MVAQFPTTSECKNKMKDYKYSANKCECGAYGPWECDCGADWRSPLEKAVANLVPLIDDPRVFEWEIGEIADNILLTPEVIEGIRHFVALLHVKTDFRPNTNVRIVKLYSTPTVE